jgi:hypothetical protein
MEPRRIYEDDRPPNRTLAYYAPVAIGVSIIIRLMLPSDVELWLKSAALAAASLALSAHCFYYVRSRSLADRFGFIVWLAAVNGVCFAVSASSPLRRSASLFIGECVALGVVGALGTLVGCLVWMPLADFVLGHYREFVSSGYCRECGYNLTGLKGSRCPECGAPLTRATAAGPRREGGESADGGRSGHRPDGSETDRKSGR